MKQKKPKICPKADVILDSSFEMLKNAKKKLSVTDGRTNQPTDQLTDQQSGLESLVHMTKKDFKF